MIESRGRESHGRFSPRSATGDGFFRTGLAEKGGWEAGIGGTVRGRLWSSVDRIAASRVVRDLLVTSIRSNKVTKRASGFLLVTGIECR